MAAALLSQLPGLLSAGKSSGFFDTIKNMAGSVLGDLGSGKVQSWKDFGQSLAGAGAAALGVHPKDQAMMQLNSDLLAKSNNAADHRVVGGDRPSTAKTMMPYGRGDEEISREYISQRPLEIPRAIAGLHTGRRMMEPFNQTRNSAGLLGQQSGHGGVREMQSEVLDDIIQPYRPKKRVKIAQIERKKRKKR